MKETPSDAIAKTYYAFDQFDKVIRAQLRLWESRHCEQLAALLKAQDLLRLHLPNAEENPDYQRIQQVLENALAGSGEGS